MMRLIDVDKLPKYTGYALSASEVAKAVENAPTVDAVSVVRCGECKWFQANMMPDGYLPNGVPEYECRHWCGAADPTDYCAYGERKGGDK